MKCIHFEKINTSVSNDAFDHPAYVEYDNEIPEIPEWCPYRIKEK